ncbi:MAG: efflux RND transporter periplasmic adaptor subunit [Arcicella sp.]|jgi:RND family efflux transporter MFP subunit|nr:efflux RND transporter periplasmic adaptor subunit [Arcicella sp.]
MKKIAILSLLLTALLASCGKKKEPKKALIEDDIIAVKLADVSQANSTDALKASGLVASLEEARLSFKTGGIIEKIYVKEGQNVRKGQLLATLNLTEINAQVQQATESVQKAERDLKRVTNLYRDSVATLEQVQNLTTALSVAKQSLEIASYNQGYSKIYASANGVIVKKLMNEGELAGPGTPVFFMNASGANDWVIKVGIADKDWTRLRNGDHATVRLDAFPETVFTASVSNLSQGADQNSGLYQAELKLNTQGKKMATGLFGNAEIMPSFIQKHTSVPIDAIVEGNGDDAFIYVVAEGKARKMSVKIVGIDNTRAFIGSGLGGINQVITDGSAYLVEGSKVKVVK